MEFLQHSVYLESGALKKTINKQHTLPCMQSLGKYKMLLSACRKE